MADAPDETRRNSWLDKLVAQAEIAADIEKLKTILGAHQVAGIDALLMKAVRK